MGGASAGTEKQEGRKEPEITEEPLELGRGETAGENVLDEDGKKVERAVEAKRRTSIEDPDDDDEGEVIVGRGR
jgi:SIT4-associating protein SAP185/190